jgi:hypothetical protein
LITDPITVLINACHFHGDSYKSFLFFSLSSFFA